MGPNSSVALGRAGGLGPAQRLLANVLSDKYRAGSVHTLSTGLEILQLPEGIDDSLPALNISYLVELRKADPAVFLPPSQASPFPSPKADEETVPADEDMMDVEPANTSAEASDAKDVSPAPVPASVPSTLGSPDTRIESQRRGRLALLHQQVPHQGYSPDITNATRNRSDVYPCSQQLLFGRSSGKYGTQ
jgi:hypothetical protein